MAADAGEVAREGQPIASLRGWIDRLQTTGRLAVARPGMALEYELSAIAKNLDGTKASLFPRPGQHRMPVVSGLVSRREWMAEAMGVDNAAVLHRFEEACRQPLPWREVPDGPAQEVVHTEVDLTRQLPVPTMNEHDGGPYISAGLLIARNPRTGIQNVSINRCQINGRDRIGVLILPRHTHFYYEMAEAADAPLEIAIVIGVDPLTLLASQAIVPIDHDELEIAGALHGRPLDVVKCRTNGVRVPAGAEIVIEGRVLPRERAPEGPFGEFPQYYGPRADRHVIAVDAITHRRDALFHTILGGGLEHLMLGAIPRAATLLSHLRRSFPNVLDVHLPLGGVGRYHLVVQIDKNQEGEAKNIIMGAFGGHYDLKRVVVVDKDVDIHDPVEVEWAIATRFQADRDLIVVAGAQGSKLDPSAEDGVSAKMGLDATAPVGVDPFRFLRIRVPGEDAVDLDAVLDPDPPADWREAVGETD